MGNYHIDLQSKCIYHIFNRAIGNEKLFRNDENYRYFLQKYLQHISPIADTLSWCLLPNHFHIIICIKPESEIVNHFILSKKEDPTNADILPDFIMERFSNFFNGYTRAFNKQYNRKGSLFMDYMRRVELSNTSQLLATTFYVHKNPVHHGLCKKVDDWKWSSYHTFFSGKTTVLKRDVVLDWFGGISEFLKYHQQEVHLKNAKILEE
ncbi:MAG: hypothetical protein JWQ25_1386 [Daejeonella sp.]|nr:hypothetical protein [Daejeonella sp.]